MDYILIKGKKKYTEYPFHKSMQIGEYKFSKTEKGEAAAGREEQHVLVPFTWQALDNDASCLYIPDKRRVYEYGEACTVAGVCADITAEQLACRLLITPDRIHIEHDEDTIKSSVFFNGVLLEETDMPYVSGDVLVVGGMRFVLLEHRIEVNADEAAYQSRLLEVKPDSRYYEGFPFYRRSPRIIKRVETENITMKRPSESKEKKKAGLLQLIVSPLIMLCITVAVSILMKRGIYVFVTAASTIVSLIFSVQKFLKDRKEAKEEKQKEEAAYDTYLMSVYKKLHALQAAEQEAYDYNYPSVEKIAEMVDSYSSRIYERTNSDDDFLTVSLGKCREKAAYTIRMDEKEAAGNRSEQEEEAYRIKNQFEYIAHKPVVIDLKKAHLGLVGEKKVIHEQLKLIVAQLAFFQSYHDLEIITIYDNKFREAFKWMNWYPHLKIRELNMYGSIYSERTRDQVLGSIHQIIKNRKMKFEESKKEGRFLPHYIFIIDEPKLIMDHSIMEYLDKCGDELGFSIIYTTYLQANLPENIGTILLLDNSEQATLLLNEKENVNKKLVLERSGVIELEKMARDLSVLVHEQGMVSHIPESITFFEMYQIERPEQLHVENRWRQNEAYKSLAVPLGVRAKEDYVYLNLHEKAHGPHGLIAGTTGSGKSEIIQSYILSLAVNFHPYDVGFLLIDYKGGGMAGLFRNLPHLLGTITNLDGSESMRALVSIKSELARRQRIFQQYNVNHINGYHKLYKQGEVSEPIPHLFLISDEFAELKKEQPEFMEELVSAARIGRSLGIHLILATQKPSGVVNDQIWTNSKFKLALKVQNEADSKEILKTPDAAGITQAGRAYLQVGNNEIYELFQSAWSGASYVSEYEEEQTDNRVYLVNEIGQGELINQDLSNEAEETTQVTQLDATIAYIRDEFDKEGNAPVPKPWLPSLPTSMRSPCVDVSISGEAEADGLSLEEGITAYTQRMEKKYSILLGKVDIPEEQKQGDYSIDLETDGNIMFVAAAGYGKTTFLTTAVLTLALKNRVSDIHFYILDFGSSGLIPLNRLPHTADYITIDDNERIGKLMRLLQKEMQRRKALFAEKMVQNFHVYNRSSDTSLPAIVLVIDNYDAIKELGYETEEFFVKVSRDGLGLGIYMMVTTTKSSNMKLAALNNYRNKIVGFLYEENEANHLLGRSSISLPDIKGRVKIKLENVNLMQVYTMADADNEVTYNAGIKQLIQTICDKYPHERAPRIPVLPEQLSDRMLDDFEKRRQGNIMLGLHKENVETVEMPYFATPFVILGESQKGKTNMLKVIIRQAAAMGSIYLFDSKSMELFNFKTEKGIHYIDTQEQIDIFLQEIAEEAERRTSAVKEKLAENPRLQPKEFYLTCRPIYIIIDDVDDFIEFVKAKGDKAAATLRKAAETGIYVIMSVHASKLKGYDEISKFVKASANGLLLSGQGNLNVFPLTSLKEIPVMGDGLLFKNGVYERLRLPKFAEEV